MHPIEQAGALRRPALCGALMWLVLCSAWMAPAVAQDADVGAGPTVTDESAVVASEPAASGPLTLTLDDVVAMALERNLDLRLAELAVREAEAAVDEAKAPSRLQVSVSGGYTRMGPTQSMQLPGGDDDDPITVDISTGSRHAYGLTARKSLNSAGRNRALRTLAELNVDVRGLEAAAARRQIALAATSLFYNIARADAFVNVSVENLESAREHWRLAAARYEAGAVPRFDVMRAEVEVANAEQNLISAETAVETVETALKTLLGIDVTREIRVDVSPVPAPIEVDALACIDIALQSREELEVAGRAIRIAEVSADLARAANGLQFGLTGTYDQTVEGGGLGAGSYSWTLTLGVSKTLTDGGATRSRIEQAMVQRKRAETYVEKLRDTISDEVWQASLTMREAATRLVSSAKTVELAQEALRIVEVQYEAGLATPVDVTDARAALTAARTNHVNATYGYQVAEAQLLSAVNVSDPELIAPQPDGARQGSEIR